MQRITGSGSIFSAPFKSPGLGDGRVGIFAPGLYPTIHSCEVSEHGRVVSAQGLFGGTKGTPVRELRTNCFI